MPSKTTEEARLMTAASKNKKFAKKVGIGPKLAKKFTESDEKGKGFKKGGLVTRKK